MRRYKNIKKITDTATKNRRKKPKQQQRSPRKLRQQTSPKMRQKNDTIKPIKKVKKKDTEKTQQN